MENTQQNNLVKNKQSHRPLRNKILLQLLCAYQQLKWLVNGIQMFNILKLHLACYIVSKYV